MELRNFYFGHAQMFVVPVEHLARTGVDTEFAAVLQEERGISVAWIDLLSSAISTYHERLEHLFTRGRGSWFPPRLQNLCVVTDPAATRPYYQPFAGASWLLYEADFDPEFTNLELAVYQLVHAERLGITRSVPRTVIGNLSYFLARSQDERKAFAEATTRCARPDAAGFRALGDAMAWVGELFHDKLRPPLAFSDEPLQPVPGVGLVITDRQGEQIGALATTFESAANDVVQAYYRHQGAGLDGGTPAERITTYLRERKPRVLFADASGEIIWDPDAPDDVDAVGPAVSGLCDCAAQGVCGDLELVAARSAAVFARLTDPDRLPSHGEEVGEEGGAYIHNDRRMMVYSLNQPGIDTAREGPPPFHRWLLGARTAHEWGHLAADAGLVRLAPGRRDEHDAALVELASLLDRVILAAPEAFREQVEDQFAARESGQTVGQAMVALQMQRIGDYKSNVLAREVLPVEEMESYVRANVRSLAAEPHSFLGKLARYAYEFQYLGLSKMEDPRHYFYSTTWFLDNYVTTGVLSREDADHMLDLMATVCACYELEPGALT
jgi:hypothetical protein